MGVVDKVRGEIFSKTTKVKDTTKTLKLKKPCKVKKNKIKIKTYNKAQWGYRHQNPTSICYSENQWILSHRGHTMVGDAWCHLKEILELLVPKAYWVLEVTSMVEF